MTTRNALTDIRAYVRSISDTRATHQATEHSYRPALQALIEALGGDGVRALNEPSHVACGAPDFIVERSGVPIGHIECKDVGINLNDADKTDQLKRYRDGLPNLILTDYLEFRWYADGELRGTVRLGRSDGRDGIRFDTSSIDQAAAFFDSFFTAHTPSIDNARDLAKRMAAKARLLRESISLVLGREGESGPLHDLLTAYSEVLINGLTPSQFADLQAQTATYGLFAARCRHNAGSGTFTRQSAVFAETTPFLRDVFGRIAGPGIDPRIAWVVDDLAKLLDVADMEAILDDFGSRAAGEDPVVHFYEDFLASYDPRLRERRGVYYTPEPVVSYIVRSVDHLLRDRFDLADGLADTSKVKVERGDGTQEDSPRVLILDPAAGTGTFLREVVASIRTTIASKGLGGVWPDYVRDHLLPRLFGFELLMAPYAICHLKLALEIGGLGFAMPQGERLNVFLTNTLEEPHEPLSGQVVLFGHEIAREAASAEAVKSDKPVMVVIGNPPYSGHSANKGPWIRSLIESYKDGFPELKKPAQAKWLNDDYVKFIRFAQWRIQRTGEGVLGFVTNHGYLDNPTFRGMRKSLMDTFDEIYLLDLHGNSKKKEHVPGGGNDENVFDIQQGVVIGLFVKRAVNPNSPGRVFHADLWGEREFGPEGGKYRWLHSNDVNTTDWQLLSPKQPQYLFMPRDEAVAEEYETAWPIPNIFSRNGDPAPGVVTTHDQFAISWDRDEAVSKVERLLTTQSETEAREIWRLCSQSQWQYDRAKQELADDSWRDQIVSILYRPFDNRVTVFDSNVAVHRRERVMRHMLAGLNLGLVTTRQASVDSGYSHVLASRFLVDNRCVYSSRGIMFLMPLYIYPTKGQERVGLGREANLASEFVSAVSSSIGLDYVSADIATDLQKSFGPEDVFHYIYAVLHSPKYRLRYAEFLKLDFPRVPLTSNLALFAALVEQGKRLTSLHLLESEAEAQPAYDVVGDNRVVKVRYAPPTDTALGRVHINSNQYFEGVTPETWEFTIGGYRPAEKWLKDRKGRILSIADIIHYRRTCAVLAETPRVMARIDEAIEAHGGWPLR